MVLAGIIIFLFGPGQIRLDTRISLPDATIERIEFQEGKIISSIRNTGPETIEISKADVNDRITTAAIEASKSLPRLAEANVIISFNWNERVSYDIESTT